MQIALPDIHYRYETMVANDAWDVYQAVENNWYYYPVTNVADMTKSNAWTSSQNRGWVNYAGLINIYTADAKNVALYEATEASKSYLGVLKYEGFW